MRNKTLRAITLVTALSFLMNAGACSKTGAEESSNAAAVNESGAGATTAEASGADANAKTAASTEANTTTSNQTDYNNLSIQGSGYEGINGTGKYNYGEALQKSLLFYELQRSGDLPDNTRCNWRGDSGMDDGKDNGVDLTGGLYDAGDNVKFNLPMAYTASVLAWSVYEYKDAYKEAGQLDYALSDIKWITDYLIKCHPEKDVYYYQVGDGNADHSWWGPCEVMSMDRPSYKVTRDNPGSTAAGQAAAALASAAVIYKDIDKDYSKKCLECAKSLYEFANQTRSDTGYTAANGFYTSNSGFYDELSWAACWLYIATNEDAYLKTSKECYEKGNHDYIWSMCWDDVHYGTQILLARITGEKQYKDAAEQSLDWWTSGTASGERIKYTPKGLAWLDSWGSLRYATTMGFLASVYAGWEGCDKGKAKTYTDFAQSQCDYALGSTGRSFVVGFGENPPEHPHHRTAQGSWCDSMNEPGAHRHTLYGALVGGPDANDAYDDTVSNYTTNEVADDYNAGFTGLLAYMYSQYHGQTIKDFGAVEEVTEDEYSAEIGVNASGDDFTEIKAVIYNKTGWPARKATNLEYRYFIDLSELSGKGKPSDIEVSANYMQSGKLNGIKAWDEDKSIYYLSVVFDDGSLYPGGQSQHKAEVQVRMRNPKGKWNPANDPSYEGIGHGSLAPAVKSAIYEDGKLVYGTEPGKGKDAGKSVGADSGSDSSKTGDTNSDGGTNVTDVGGDSANGSGDSGSNSETQSGSGGNDAKTGNTTASSGDLTLDVKYDSKGGNSISGSFVIKNKSKKAIDFKGLTINYYMNDSSGKRMVFDCYYAGVTESDGMHTQINGITGEFGKTKLKDCDNLLVIAFPGNGEFKAGASVTVNFAIHYEDWQNLDAGDDYSARDAGNIVIKSGTKAILGKEPS